MTRRSRPPTDEQETAVFDGPHRAHRRTRRGISREADAAQAAQAKPEPIARAGERSEPIRVISMKAAVVSEPQTARQHHVKLRPLSEVSGHDTPASGIRRDLGFLAPPRDPRAVRTRRLRDLVVWGGTVVALAGVVTIGVWLLARS